MSALGSHAPCVYTLINTHSGLPATEIRAREPLNKPRYSRGIAGVKGTVLQFWKKAPIQLLPCGQERALNNQQFVSNSSPANSDTLPSIVRLGTASVDVAVIELVDRVRLSRRRR